MLAEIFEKWEGPGGEFSGSRKTAGMGMLDEVSRAVPVFLASVPRNASIERNSFPAQTRIPMAARAYGAKRVYSSFKTREINAWILNVNVETAKNGREGLDPAAEEFGRCRSKGRYPFAAIHEWMNSVSGGPDGPRAETDVEEDISPPATPNDRSAKNATVEDEDEDKSSSSDPKITSSTSPAPFPLTGGSAATSGDSPHFDGTPVSSERDTPSSKGSNKRRIEEIFTIPSAKRSRGKYDWEIVSQLHHYVEEVVECTPEIESNSVAFKTRNKRSMDEGTFGLPSPKRARASLDFKHKEGGGDIKDIVLPIIEVFAPDYKFPATAIETVQGSEAESTVFENTGSSTESEAENKSTRFENIELSIDQDYFKPMFATKPGRTRGSNVLKLPISEGTASSVQRPDKPTGIRKILSRLFVSEENMPCWFSTKSSKTLDHNILQPSTIPASKTEDKLVITHKMPSLSDEASLVPRFSTKSSRNLNFNVLMSPIVTGVPPILQRPVVIRRVISILHECNMAKWFATKSVSALESKVLSRLTTPPPKENKFVQKFTLQSEESCILPMFATKSSRVRNYTVLSPITPPDEIKESIVTQEVDSESDEDCFLSMFATKARQVRNYGTSSKPRQNQSAPIRRIRSRPAVSEEEDISYGFATKSSRIFDQNVLTSLTPGTPPRKNHTLPAFAAKMSCVSDYNVVSTPRTPSLQKGGHISKLVSKTSEATILPELTTKSSRTPSYDLLSTPVPIISGEILSPRRLNKTKRIPKISVTPPNDDSFQPPNISRVLDDHALATSISWRPTWNSQTRCEVVPVIIVTPPDEENFQPPKSNRVLDYNALAIYSLKRLSAQKEDRPIPTIVITAPDKENISPMFTMASPTLAEVGSSCKSRNKTAVSKKMTPPPKKENIVPMFKTKSSRVLDDNVLASPPLSKTGPSLKTGNKPILPKIVSPPEKENIVPMFTTKSSRTLDNDVLKSPTLSKAGSGSGIGNKPILPKEIISPLAGKTLIPAPATRTSRTLDHNVLTPLSISAENSVSPRRYTLTKIGKSIPKVRKTQPMFIGKSSRIADANVFSLQKKKTKVGSVLPRKPATVHKTTSSIPKKITPCASKVKGKTVLEGKSTNARTKPVAAGDKPPPSTLTTPNKKRVIPTIAIAKGNSPRIYTTTVRKTTAPTVPTEKKDASAFQRESAPVVLPADSILPATKTLPTTRQNSLPTTVEKKVTTKKKFNSKAIRSTAVGGIKIRPMNLTLSLCPKEGRCLRASASSFVPCGAEKTVELIPKVLSARRN